MALSKSQKSLRAWTRQKWRTKSGKPSTQGSKATGERYLPEKAIKAMTPAQYAASTRAEFQTDYEADKIIASIGPSTVEHLIKQGKDRQIDQL